VNVFAKSNNIVLLFDNSNKQESAFPNGKNVIVWLIS